MLIGFVLIARAITSSRLRTLYMILLVLAVTMSSLAIGQASTQQRTAITFA